MSAWSAMGPFQTALQGRKARSSTEYGGTCTAKELQATELTPQIDKILRLVRFIKDLHNKALSIQQLQSYSDTLHCRRLSCSLQVP